MTRITTRMLLIPLCCIATTACEPARPFDRDDAPAADPTPISVSSVLEQPSSYTGRQITLAGEIVDVFSPRAFSIRGEQYLENDVLLIVIDQNGEGAERATVTDRGARVQVSGTLAEDATALNLDPALIPKHLSTPVLLARAVAIAPVP